MIYKKLSLSVLLFAAGFLTASAQKSPQDMDRFIDVLMNKMTLEEKIGQEIWKKKFILDKGKLFLLREVHFSSCLLEI